MDSDILGLGTDIVSVPRISGLIDRRGEAFLRKWFTDAEIAYCQSKAHPAQHFAARIAGKEAVVKALRLPWVDGSAWPHIEILPGADGAPVAILHGRLRTETVSLLVSLSHCDGYATAVALTRVGAPGVDTVC